MIDWDLKVREAVNAGYVVARNDEALLVVERVLGNGKIGVIYFDKPREKMSFDCFEKDHRMPWYKI